MMRTSTVILVTLLAGCGGEPAAKVPVPDASGGSLTSPQTKLKTRGSAVTGDHFKITVRRPPDDILTYEILFAGDNAIVRDVGQELEDGMVFQLKRLSWYDAATGDEVTPEQWSGIVRTHDEELRSYPTDEEGAAELVAFLLDPKFEHSWEENAVVLSGPMFEIRCVDKLPLSDEQLRAMFALERLMLYRMPTFSMPLHPGLAALDVLQKAEYFPAELHVRILSRTDSYHYVVSEPSADEIRGAQSAVARAARK